MGQVLHWGLLQDWEPVGAETHVSSELATVRGFSESDRWGFGKKILGWWIQGEDMETFPEDPFETVKARIVGGDERQNERNTGRCTTKSSGKDMSG